MSSVLPVSANKRVKKNKRVLSEGEEEPIVAKYHGRSSDSPDTPHHTSPLSIVPTPKSKKHKKKKKKTAVAAAAAVVSDDEGESPTKNLDAALAYTTPKKKVSDDVVMSDQSDDDIQIVQPAVVSPPASAANLPVLAKPAKLGRIALRQRGDLGKYLSVQRLNAEKEAAAAAAASDPNSNRDEDDDEECTSDVRKTEDDNTDCNDNMITYDKQLE